MNIEHIILTFGYPAIVIFMITNGIISLPSSQFIYVTVGFLIPSGMFSFIPVVVLGTIGNTIGNVILYEFSARRGLAYVSRWKAFPEKRILKLHTAFKRRGPLIIFIGKFLPGIKVLIPVVAGIALMNRITYVILILVTSFLWALGLTYFGFYFGKNYSNGTFGWFSVVLTLFTIGAMYTFHRYVQKISIEE